MGAIARECAYKKEHPNVAARPPKVKRMNAFVSKLLVATLGLTLVTAPLAANAAQWGVGIGIGGGGGVAVNAGYHNGWRGAPPPRYGYYGRPGYYHRPYYGPVYREGYYGLAPGGYYGYYSRGHWFAHRRWNGGVWLYF